jgi:hypothetical protein
MTHRILVYHGKHADSFWIVDTPARMKGAMKALFKLLDEDGCYYEGDVKESWLTAARRGEMPYVLAILESRNGYEYECWSVEDAEIAE